MNALCVGGAECVWNDLSKVPKGWADVVIACNDIGCHLQDMDHWVTMHPEHLRDGPNWLEQREKNFPDKPYELWIPKKVRQHMNFGANRSIEIPWPGSSGLFTVQVALKLGATNMVLAGIPLEQTPHFFDDHPWTKYHQFRDTWTEKHKEGVLDNVRSLSGWTQELLGVPMFEV